jgi:hypothetical protein
VTRRRVVKSRRVRRELRRRRMPPRREGALNSTAGLVRIVSSP